jgi:predicted ATPase
VVRQRQKKSLGPSRSPPTTADSTIAVGTAFVGIKRKHTQLHYPNVLPASQATASISWLLLLARAIQRDFPLIPGCVPACCRSKWGTMKVLKHSPRSGRSRRTSDDAGTSVRGPQFLLESVSLERFKAAFRPDPLSISPFTVIIGRNGSGKSTVLEALQWLDIAMRHDAIRACDRYSGIHDLLNIRSRGKTRYFKLGLSWKSSLPKAAGPTAEYELRVDESTDGRPLIHSETLIVREANHTEIPIIRTEVEGNRDSPGRRVLFPNERERSRIFDEPDRLALNRLAGSANDESLPHVALEAIRSFWERAVFLRLSPQRLAQGSPPKRRSFDPILDEEGQTLPALLNELTPRQKAALVEAVQSALPDVRGLVVSETSSSREQNAYWSMKEKMPIGYAGKGSYEIPASMLSEGTRRLTAILALLIRRPPPSLLCIEEIENGLDPWTVLDVLDRLKNAPRRGTQAILTSHSPWLLDNVDLDAIRLVNRKDGTTRYSTFRGASGVKKFLQSVPPGARYVNLMDSE